MAILCITLHQMKIHSEDLHWEFQVEELLKQWNASREELLCRSGEVHVDRGKVETALRLLEKTSTLSQDSRDLELSLWSQKNSERCLAYLFDRTLFSRETWESYWREISAHAVAKLSHSLWRKNSSSPAKNLLAESRNLV